MTRPGPIIAGLVVVAALVAVLIGTWQASVPFIAPGDLATSHEGRRVQVEGVVVDLRSDGGGVAFELSDTNTVVTVRYPYGASRPLTLENGRVVVAKGVYRGGSLEAHQVSVRAHEAGTAGDR